MKPDTSARKSRGILKELQVLMKRVALSEESTKSTPPLTRGWLATMPTARPPRRAKPTMISGAKSFLTSRKLPPSISELMKSYMLNGLLCTSGTISFNGRSLAGGTGSMSGTLPR